MRRLDFSILTIGTLALGIVATEAKPVQLTADQIGVIEQTVRYLMKDQTNVKFGKPAATTSSTGAIMCVAGIMQRAALLGIPAKRPTGAGPIRNIAGLQMKHGERSTTPSSGV